MHNIITNLYKQLGIEYLYIGEEKVKEIANTIRIAQDSSVVEEKKTREEYNKSELKNTINIAIPPKDAKKSIQSIPTSLPTTSYGAIDIDGFESRFKSLCSKLQRTPCVWTYYLLGNDMFGNPCASRREDIRTLLGTLSMPQGTYSFIPFTAPNEEGTLEVYIKEFLGILQIYKPSLVLFFGMEAIQILFPEKQITYWQEFVVISPVRGIVLPDVEEISKEQGKITAYLKEYNKRSGLLS